MFLQECPNLPNTRFNADLFPFHPLTATDLLNAFDICSSQTLPFNGHYELFRIGEKVPNPGLIVSVFWRLASCFMNH